MIEAWIRPPPWADQVVSFAVSKAAAYICSIPTSTLPMRHVASLRLPFPFDSLALGAARCCCRPTDYIPVAI